MKFQWFEVAKPTCPLLFLFNCDKKIKDIERYGSKKWAFGHKHKKGVFRLITPSNHNNILYYFSTRKIHALL